MEELKKGNKKGFTLAEVLITLGIIGVVASLTIPTLMANYQKVQEVAGLKKAYAEITEALRLMANDHGCPDDLKCTNAFIFGDNETLGNEFKKYFKLAKDCGSSYDSNDEKTKCLATSWCNHYDGSGGREDMNDDQDGYYNFITADGFGVSLFSYDCADSGWSTANLNINQLCADVWVDVNGAKGPNNWGRDIFEFYITNGRGPALYPQRGSEFLETTTNTADSWIDASGIINQCFDGDLEGKGCAARIMEQGWQMKY